MCVLACLAGLCLPAAAAPAEGDQSVLNGCHSTDAAMQLGESGKLVETSKAVIVYELKSGTMIYAWNPDERIYPSSMVKLMTALLAIENGQLSDKVTVTKRALSNVEMGSVSAGLKAGEELTLEDLLYCMMVASANDAAVVIAEHIGGNQDLFVEKMNRRAGELGCTGTVFTNCHGLHDENSYTTARDICRILEAALGDPVFKAMFCAREYTVPATNKSEERIVRTTNYMMSTDVVKKYYDARVTGGKTGATDEAGRCLAATSEGSGMELLTIVMGAKAEYEENGVSLKSFGSFEETAQLLDYAFEHFEYRQIFYEGQTVAQFPVEGGTNSVTVKPQRTASTVLPLDLDVSKLTWIYAEPVGTVSAPVAQGQKLSALQVWYGAKCLAQADLVAIHAVPVWQPPVIPDPPPEQKDAGSWSLLLYIGGGILALAALVGIGFFVKGRIQAAMRSARRRRRRINRRRSR